MKVLKVIRTDERTLASRSTIALKAMSANYCHQPNRSKKYSSDKHAPKLLVTLNDIRKKKHFCDGIVIIGKTEIPVQKGVLASASHYFRLAFDGERDSGNGIVDLTPLQIDEGTFETILTYIYTSEIILNEDNIQDILQAADLLLLADLKSSCCNFLEDCISVDNCIGIWQFASRFNCRWIHLKTSEFIDNNLRDVSYSSEFLNLPVETLTALLSKDTICVPSEMDILHIILRWMKHDEEGRKQFLSDLFDKCVRPQYLSDIVKVGEVMSQYLEEDYTGLSQLQMKCPWFFSTKATRKRGVVNVLVEVGGDAKNFSSDKELTSVEREAYCLATWKHNVPPKWLPFPPLIQTRCAHSVVEAGGCLYVVGGKDKDNSVLNTGEKYDPHTNTWTAITSMNYTRYELGLVAVDDNIYAIGGNVDINTPTSSMEVYNIFTNTWKLLPDMNIKRQAFAVAAVGKKIYVMAGGFDGKLYTAVECFDTVTLTWTSVSPMRECRHDAKAISVGEDIYVFGGYRRYLCPSAMHSGNNIKFCGTEIYSSVNNCWYQVPEHQEGACSMTDASQITSVLFNNNQIWVIGLLDTSRQMHHIRTCNVYSRQWQCVTMDGPTKSHNRLSPCSMLRIPAYVLDNLMFDCSGLF